MRHHPLRVWILFWVLTTARQLDAAFEDLPVGGRSAGLAGVSSVGMDGPEAVFGNPALLGWTDSPACLFDVSRLFGLVALNRSAFAASFKAGACGMGLGFQTFGSSLYRENTAVFSAGLSSDGISFGLSVRALQLAIARYGDAGSWTMDAGFGLRLWESVNFGASASNLLDAKLDGDRMALPKTLRMGLDCHQAPNAVFLIETVKEKGFPIDLRSGVELRLRRIELRIGIGTSPSLWTWGFGIRLGPIRVDLAVSEHPVLGPTRHVSVVLGGRRP